MIRADGHGDDEFDGGYGEEGGACDGDGGGYYDVGGV